MKIDQIKEGSKLIIAIEGKLDAVTAMDFGKVIRNRIAGTGPILMKNKVWFY